MIKPDENGKINASASGLENIWHYGWQHFGEIKADRYINHLPKYSALRVRQ